MKFGSIRFDDVITRAKNDVVFYLFVRHAREDLGCKISGLLTFFYFCKFRLETGEFEEKMEKEVFGWAKTAKHGYFVSRPQASLTISQGSIFFLIGGMSLR